MGHPPDAVWRLTPRELKGWLEFASARRKREISELLQLHAMAARGDQKELKKLITDLGRE